jgi:hypothetical protein
LRNIDEVLDAVKSSDKETLNRQLNRLPSTDHVIQAECRAAAVSWRQRVQWTWDDPAYARDPYLSAPSHESKGEPCKDLYFLVPKIIRTQALCRQRLHSPGAYRGIGEAECRNNDVIQAGVDTLRLALVYGNGREPYVWYGMADAFLLIDDDERAEEAFFISAFIRRGIGLDEKLDSLAIVDERWLYRREEILIARAAARSHLWNDEPVSDEINAKLRAPWPEEPPPKKPDQRRP